MFPLLDEQVLIKDCCILEFYSNGSITSIWIPRVSSKSLYFSLKLWQVLLPIG